MFTGALTGVAQAADAPRAAYAGQIPMGDMAGEAGTLAGLLALGGAGSAGRNIMDYDPSVVGMNFPGVQAINDMLSAKYPDAKISVSGDPSRGYTLNRIEVPKSQRSSGTGTAIMQDFVAAADAQGAVAKLSPSSDFGGSVPRLKDFYKRFGFVENKGKNADYGISESMYRLPQSIPVPTDPATARGQEIMGMLTSGRAGEVTDQMLDLGDPVLNARLNEYLYSNYDLPMDTASRMARSEAFGETGYHSTSADFPYFAPPTKAGVDAFPTQQPTFLARSEAAASDMGRGAGTNIIPVRARTASLFDPAMLQENPGARWLEDSWSPLGRKLLDDISAGRVADAADDPESYAAAAASGQWDLVESAPFQQWLRQQGFSDFNVSEAGNANFAVVDPTRIRSLFARFDPRLSHLRNLNAALTAGIPLGLLAMQPEQEQY
jgi:hypothetical protein